MRKLLVFIIFLLVGVGIFFLFHEAPVQQLSLVPKQDITETPVPATNMEKSIFVPYWTLDNKTIPPSYTSVIYFGVTVNENGVDKKDPGYKAITKFMKSVDPSEKTLLAVRMLDRDTNEKILESKAVQQQVIQDALNVAKQNNFDGVVLDLEQNAIAFDSVVASITNFSSSFAQAVKAQHMTFYQAIYGDAVYRLRPYDIAAIGKASDGLFVMAYDLHKAGADPGPNFPVESAEEYTFGAMLDDFLKKVPSQKLAIVLGMYGYSWPVDGKGQTTAQADAKSLLEIETHISPTCTYTNCKVTQNTHDSSTKVTYTENGKSYVIYFDNPDVIQKKEVLVKEKGISHLSYWAYSYF